jgi:Holliday junction resolvase RusA-like endonuclease
MKLTLAEYMALEARQRAKASAKASLRPSQPQNAATGMETPGKGIPALVITLPGQIRGGKNNMVVTRTGRHFPRPEWAKWRDAMVTHVKRQLPVDWQPIAVPVNVRLDYAAGDKRRRDQPAIIDAIFHVLEKAGVVTDDTLIWITESSRCYDKTRPGAVVKIFSAA